MVPIQERCLFEKTVFIEKVTSLGTVLRLKLEPLDNEQVKLLEDWRKPKRSAKFKRVHNEEGKVLAFEALKLRQGFQEVFELEGVTPSKLQHHHMEKGKSDVRDIFD